MEFNVEDINLKELKYLREENVVWQDFYIKSKNSSLKSAMLAHWRLFEEEVPFWVVLE